MRVELYHGLDFCYGDNTITGTYGMDEETAAKAAISKVETLLGSNPEACFADYPLSGFGLRGVVDVTHVHCIDVDSFATPEGRGVPEWLIEDGKCVYETPKEDIPDLYTWMRDTAPGLRGRRNDSSNYYCEVFGHLVTATQVWFVEGYPEHEERAKMVAQKLNLPLVKVEKKKAIWA